MNPTPERLTVRRAFDREPIADVPLTPWDRVDAWLDRAVELHRDRSGWLPVHRRVEILRDLAGRLRAERDELALTIVEEGGKPLADALVEADRAVSSVAIAAGELENLRGTEVPMDLTAAGAGHRAFTEREPIGPVVAISAFNHPLNLIAHQVAPAIAAGCPVIVKPAATTPLSCLRFVELVRAAGLDESWCMAAVTDVPTAERMATDPRTAFLTFIGSARVGWHLRSRLAPGTRCALEHGGAAPVIVAADADLEHAVPSLVKGGYYHAGQVCVSVQRIFVHQALATDLLDRLTDAVEQLVVGDPTDLDTDVGPMILPREVERVDDWVREAVDAGGRAVIGAEPLSETTYSPTVLLEPPANAKVSTLEIFGPVTCVYGYQEVDDALARANALPLAFQGAVYARDVDVAHDTARRLAGSAIMINEHPAFRVDWMPFAGLRESGYGVGGIGYTLRDMTVEKMIVTRSGGSSSRRTGSEVP